MWEQMRISRRGRFAFVRRRNGFSRPCLQDHTPAPVAGRWRLSSTIASQWLCRHIEMKDMTCVHCHAHPRFLVQKFLVPVSSLVSPEHQARIVASILQCCLPFIRT